MYHIGGPIQLFYSNFIFKNNFWNALHEACLDYLCIHKQWVVKQSILLAMDAGQKCECCNDLEVLTSQWLSNNSTATPKGKFLRHSRARGIIRHCAILP